MFYNLLYFCGVSCFFSFIDLLYCFLKFYFIYFCSDLYYFLPPIHFGRCSFSSFFRWTVILCFLRFYLLLFFNLFLFLFKYSCLHFHLPTPPHPCLPPSNLPLLALSMCPLYMFLDGPSPVSPHYPFPLSLLVTLSLFFISVSLVIFCLLVCFVD